MRILIVEPHADGHRAGYLRWLVQGVVDRGWSVTIASTSVAMAHPALAGLADRFDGVRVELMTCMPRGRRFRGRVGLIRSEFEYWAAFKNAADGVRAKTPIDAVIVPYVDYCFHALAILGSPFREMPWSGIAMRLSLAAAQPGSSSLPFKWRLAMRLLSDPKLTKLFVINPSIEDVPSSWGRPALLSKLSYLPDPAELRPAGGRASARSTLGIAADRVAILVFGSLDERKGISALVASIASQEDLGSYVVILAGKPSPIVRDELRAPPCAGLLAQRRLILIDRFLSDEEQGLVFSAADVVWVGYRNHPYMSGVLVLAGRAGLPVIGTPDGEIGRSIARYTLGIAARGDDVRSALRALLDVRTRAEMGERSRAVFVRHTVENFAATVTGAFLPTEAESLRQ